MLSPFVELLFNHAQYGLHIMAGVFFCIMKETDNLAFPCMACFTYFQ